MPTRQLFKNLLLFLLVLSLCAAPLGIMTGAREVGAEGTMDPRSLNGAGVEGGRASSSPGVLAMTWAVETVDDLGNVGQFTSLALDSAGRPHISYQDMSNLDLKYAYYDGSAWTSSTVDSDDMVGWFTSLALDSSGWPHISYLDVSNYDLKYAYYVGATVGNCGPAKTWQCDTVDSVGAVGGFTSLGIDASSHVHISYYDYNNGDLKYASQFGPGGNCGPGGTWKCVTVDSSGNVGQCTSLKLDAAGRPHISYYDAGNGHLKYAYFDGAVWYTETVDDSALDVGQYASLALDSAGLPHISYLDASHGKIRYARYVGGGGQGCGTSQTWQCDELDDVQSDGGYTSLALDRLDRPHVSYYYFPDSNLQYAYYVGAGGGNCGPAASWRCEIVDSTTGVGQFTSLDVDASFRVHISYYYAMPPYYGLKHASGCLPVEQTTITGTDFLEIGASATYTATYLLPNATLPVTLTWDNSTVGSTSVYSWTQSGLHTITVTATGSCGPTEITGTFAVTVCQPLESVQVHGPPFVLTGDTATYTATYTPFSATLPVTLTWSNGTVGDKAVYIWTGPGLYTVTVTATSRCSGPITGTLPVSVCQPVTDVLVSGPPELVVNEIGHYTATYSPENANKPVTFIWNNGTAGPTADYSWPEAGLYTIIVTATNPCEEKVVGTFQVSVTCEPVSSVPIEGPEVLLVNEVGLYTATVIPQNATDPVTVTWDDGTVGYTATYSWQDVGLHTITVTATNPCGAVVTGTFPVSVTLCQAVSSVEIDGPGVLLVNEVGTYMATWSPPDATTPVTVTWDDGTQGYTATYSWSGVGLYTITVTATNRCGPVVTGTLPVSVTLCKPVSSAAVDGPEVLLVKEVGTYTARWSPANASEPVTVTWDDGTQGYTATYSWSGVGLYTITVTATNPCGPVVTGTLPVSVTLCKPLTGVTLSGPEVLPVGQAAEYTAAPRPWNATPPVTFTWDNATVGPAATYSWTEVGWHTITVTATNRCESGTVHGTLAVDVCRPVSAVTVSGPSTRQVGQEGIYVATYSPLSATLPVTFTWSNGTVSAEAVYSWTVAGRHALTATASSICGSVPGSAVVTVFGRIYLPLVLGCWNRCFINNLGFWEIEPNNGWGAANGPLCSRQEYYGYADDSDDLFYILHGVGSFAVTVTNYVAEGAQLVVYNERHDVVAWDPGPGPLLTVTGVFTESGQYFIRLYGTGGYTTTQWYTLVATFPEQ
jgi:hypothetical protein